MGKFARTWQLMGEAWRVLQQDKRLIVFPLIAGAVLAVVIVLFALPVFTAMGPHPRPAGTVHMTAKAYLAMFAFYFLAYSVIIFFNAALIACVLRQIEGGKATIGYGLAFAWQRLPQLVAWALLASSVGMLLRMLEEKVGFIGRIVVGLLGMAWSVTSFLVVPVLVAEGSGPIEAYRRSVDMLRRTWGEQIIGNVSFGLIFGLFGIAPAIVVLMLFPKSNAPLWFLVGAILVAWIVLLALVQSTLQTIYQAAIYKYAADGEAPDGFDGQLIAGAFRDKSSGSGW